MGIRLGVLLALLLLAGGVIAADKPTATPSNEPPKSLLVVAPAVFEAALSDFIAFKNKLLPTEFCSLESILAKSAGVDDPEKLKRHLYTAWREHHLGYALLVGDVDVLPVRYMVLDRVTPAAFDYAFYPSDLYYSDLAHQDGSFDDWNARKDGFHAGYFGEVRGEKNKGDDINYDGIDYRPDIAVGRWPVSTLNEVRLLAAKSMTHEQQVLANDHPQIRRVAFFAVGGWVDSRDLQNRLAGKLAKGWEVEKRFYTDRGQTPNTPAPNHQEVRSALDSGLGLLVHAGHGTENGWDQCLSLADLDRLTNAPMLPVVMSAGCSTAHFAPLPPYEPYLDVAGKEHAGSDHGEVFNAPPLPPAAYQTGRFNPSCLGEQILKRSTNGAVAYLGCNTGSQPCGLTLLEGFITAVAERSEPRLGDCWTSAVARYYDREHLATLTPTSDWYPPSIFFQGMKFMLFGDPSLRLPGNAR